MRTIKFRAWDTFNAEMFPEKVNDDLLVNFFREVNMRRNGGNTVIVMQFTGLFDKNGKEIYEGDILDLHSTVNGVNLFEVYYNEAQARFSIKYYTNRMPKRSLEYEYSVTEFFRPCSFSGEVDFERIGNIYENGGLLNDRPKN